VVEDFGAVKLFAVSALLLPLVGGVFAVHLRRQARQGQTSR